MSKHSNDQRHRRFISGAIAAVVLVFAVIVLGFARGNRPKGDIDGNRFLLDTVVSIKIYESDDEELLDQAFTRIAEFEAELSRHQSGSEVSKINDAPVGEFVSVSKNTMEVLIAALEYARISNGAFDPTVGPLVDLWGIGGDNPRVPEAEEIAEVLKLVDYKLIRTNTDDNTVSLETKGSTLDLGGIAKGWIADEIAGFLKSGGVDHALINLGGNVRLIGGKPGGEPYRIGMQDPFDDRGSYLGIFTVAEGSVVSSGIYERFFEVDGIRYHHILDTGTGYPVDKGLAAVTVISEESLDGDALSTTLFALGIDEGSALVASLDGVEAAFVTTDGTVVLSPGADRMFEATKANLEVQILPNT